MLTLSAQHLTCCCIHPCKIQDIRSIQEATAQDANLQDLKAYSIHGWPHKKDDVTQDIQKYWPIKHEFAMIYGVAEKGKRIIMPSQLQMLILSELHGNQMGIKKTWFLACKSIYLVNINADIESAMKHCSSCLKYQNTQLQEKTILYKVLYKLEIGWCSVM